MAASSNTAGQPKYGPGNAFDGLRIAPPTPAFTCAAYPSGAKPLPYDVFINHHGGDVKYTVANSICNSLNATGLRVFLDKNELKLVDFFPRALQEAMRSASLHIAIFSEHYAQHPWCLAKLAFMVETGAKIIPVFYHAEPSALRLTIQGKGMYAATFSNFEMKSSEEHEKKRRYSSEQLQHRKWALHEASFLIGDIINNQDEEQRVVKNVVNRVMKEMKKVPLEVAKHLVGVGEAVQNFDTVALQSSGSIQIVGIWGMGGSGKTFLIKKISNNKHSDMNRSSLLFDLQDVGGERLPVEKQKRLLEDLDVKGVSFDN